MTLFSLPSHLLLPLLYGFFFFFSSTPVIHSLFVISPGLNNGQMFRINHADAPLCTIAPPEPTYYQLVSIKGDDGCNNTYLTALNITGKAVLFQIATACNPDVFFSNMQAQGAKVLLTSLVDSTMTQTPGWPGRLYSPGGINYQLICTGITVYDYHTLASTIASGSNITVMTYQKPIQPNQTYALSKLLPLFVPTPARGDWTAWNPDLCTKVLTTYPARPNSYGCDEDGMVSFIVLPPQIQGELPEELSLFSSLWFFVISPSFGITGSFHMSYANWTRLEVLHFEDTFLNYIPPDLFKSWPILKDFFFRNADLVGPLPTVVASTVKNVILDNNRLSGPIPPTLVQHPDIFEINLLNNNLTGTIPDLDMLTKLQWLTLGGNKLTGIGKIPNGLLSLDISNNGLSELPNVEQLTGVSTLNFAFNKLTKFPNLKNLTLLTEIRAEFNQISGHVEQLDVFPSGPNLKIVHLSGNQINSFGWFGYFPQLIEIHLDFNNLTDFPDFYEVADLSYLDVSYNQIESPLSAEVIYNFPKNYLLTHFGARSNKIYQSPVVAYDTIIINYCTLLTELDLSFNNISLFLPTLIKLPSVITHLYLNGNNLIGTVPEDWVQLERLSDIRLDSNDLSSDGIILPTYMDYNFKTYTTYDSLGMQCPAITLKRDPLATITLDPSYYSYQLCRCMQNYYYIPNSDPAAQPRCYPCLDFAVCPGEEKPFLFASENINIVARQGYFPSPNRSYPTQILPCQYGVLRPDDPMNPCNPGIGQNFVSNNVRDLSTPFICRNGSSDRLCSRCDIGYYAKNGKCFTCDAQASYPTFFIIFILVLFFFAAYFAVPSLVEEYDQNAPLVYEIGPVLLDFFQTTSIITSRLDNPSVTHSLQSALGVAAMSTSQSGLGMECLTGFPDFVTQYYWTVGAPGLWIALMYFFFLCKFLIFKCLDKYLGWKKEFELIVRGTLMIMNFVYFPIVTTILTVYGCDTDPATGVRYLRDRPYMRCDEISPVAKAVPLVVYLVGIYMLFAGLSFRLGASKKRRMDDFYVTIFGFFYLPFYGGKIWAGVVFMLVKLCISIVVAVVSFKADYFGILIVWILNCKLIFVIYQRPYSVPALNTFEILSCIFAVFVFLNSIIFSSSALFNESIMPALTWFLLVLILIIVAIYLVYKDQNTRALVIKALSKTGLTTRNLESHGSIGPGESGQLKVDSPDEEDAEGKFKNKPDTNGALEVETDRRESIEPVALSTPQSITKGVNIRNEPRISSTPSIQKSNKGSQSNLVGSHSTELLLNVHPEHHHTSSQPFLPTPSHKQVASRSPKSESKGGLEAIDGLEVGIELQALSSPHSKSTLASPSKGTTAMTFEEEDDSDSSDEDGYPAAGGAQGDRPRRHSEGRKKRDRGDSTTRKNRKS